MVKLKTPWTKEFEEDFLHMKFSYQLSKKGIKYLDHETIMKPLFELMNKNKKPMTKEKCKVWLKNRVNQNRINAKMKHFPKSMEKLDNDLCKYCSRFETSNNHTDNLCNVRWCEEAYEYYLEQFETNKKRKR